MALRFESHVAELADVVFQRHAVLQAHRNGRAEGVHQAADGAAFLGHRDEQLAGPAIGEHADGDVALVAGDAELVRDRLSRVSGRRSRRGLAARAASLSFALSASVPVFSGWLSFEPSR